MKAQNKDRYYYGLLMYTLLSLPDDKNWSLNHYNNALHLYINEELYATMKDGATMSTVINTLKGGD